MTYKIKIFIIILAKNIRGLIHDLKPYFQPFNLGLWSLLCLPFFSMAQTDSLYMTDALQKLQEVVVTATKTKRQLSTTTVPVTLINTKNIKATNAFRIQTVLDEYTGLNTVSSALGTGIQMQGLDADYSLIMIDGVPIVGRLNGVLDLSRLTTANISHIEIVKGPSSVLFGSNALAGVINIITKKDVNKNSLTLSSRAGSFNTYDVGLQSDISKGKYRGVFSANYFSTGGYDLASNYQGYNLSTDYYGKTVSPHDNYSLGLQNTFKVTKNLDIHINGRLFKEKEVYQFKDADDNIINGNGNLTDWSVTPLITYRKGQWMSKLRFNYSDYKTKTQELYSDNNIYSSSFFNESNSLLDWQNDYTFNKKHLSTIGLGYTYETVQTSRLSSEDVQGANDVFVYAQHQYKPTNKLDFVLGVRLENHQNYKQQFNPKLSMRYAPNQDYIFKASIGRGFKKPDFKQLYFNYTNNAIGYTVLGTTYVEEGIAALNASNQIALDPTTQEPILYDLYYKILENGGKITAENSTGINLGLSIRKIKNTIIDLNIYRNDLNNLIETTPIALKTNGWQAYSYQNINRVYTQGVELDIKYYLGNKFKLQWGYQYLDAKDKNIVKQLKEGSVYAKDINTGVSYKVASKDYGGLLDRAKHNAHFKFSAYDIYKGIDFNFRVFYKGKFGYADLNNNQILDIDQEYIKGYFLTNTSLHKSFLKDKLNINFGVDNVFNYTYATPEYTISSLPGRKLFLSINYKILK